MSEQDKDKAASGETRPGSQEDKGDGVRPPVPVQAASPEQVPATDDDVQLGTDADIDLPEPHLDEAAISEDVAKTTSLDEVEAEAEQVAQEAEAAGTLVAGREAAPRMPPAGQRDRDKPGTSAAGQPAPLGRPAGRPAPQRTAAAGQPAPPRPWVPPQPAVPAYLPAEAAGGPEPGTRRARRGTAAGKGKGRGRKRLPLAVGAAVVALVLIALLIWLIVSLASGGGQSSTRSGAPQDWKQGDCLKGFSDASHPADVVPCTAAHSAQLVGTYFYPTDAGYPGADTLKAKAQDVCTGVKLTPASEKYSLKQFTAYPSETTWNNKDRRVDCLISDTDGDKITESLIK